MKNITRKSKYIKKKKRYFLLFLSPSLAGVSIFVLAPFLDVFRRSFSTAVTGQWNGINNYRMIFTNQAFQLAVRNTFRFTAVCIPLLVAAGLLIAYPLSRLPDAGPIKSLYLFPYAMPTATIVMVWKMVFSRQGFLNLLLTKLSACFAQNGSSVITAVFRTAQAGASAPVRIDYLETGTAFFVLVLTYLWKNIGYTVILWLAGIMMIPRELTEAARVDGAGGRQCFFRIMLPNLKGSLLTIVILSFLNSFKIYREAYLVAGAYPQQDIYLLQHLFNNWFVNLDFDKMAAAAVCVGMFLFIMIMLLQYLWDRE